MLNSRQTLTWNKGWHLPVLKANPEKLAIYFQAYYLAIIRDLLDGKPRAIRPGVPIHLLDDGFVSVQQFDPIEANILVVPHADVLYSPACVKSDPLY